MVKLATVLSAVLLAVSLLLTPACLFAAESAHASQGAVATININTASEKELQNLPGIGKVTAGRIVEYREKNGTFQSPDQLSKVKGVGKKTLEKIVGMISVE